MNYKNHLDFEIEESAFSQIVESCANQVLQGTMLRKHQINYLQDNIKLAKSWEVDIIRILISRRK